MKTPKYVFCDIETTGLDPATDLILEIALVVTDKDLNEIAGEGMGSYKARITNGYGPCGTPLHHLILAKNDYVREMHTKNGLLEELDSLPPQIRLSMAEIDDEMCAWIGRFPPPPPDERGRPGKLIIAGASIDFDKGFLGVRAPKFHAMLSHQRRDVSSDKMMFKDAIGMEFEKAEAHRAMADVQESLTAARAMMAELRRMKELSDAWRRHVGES